MKKTILALLFFVLVSIQGCKDDPVSPVPEDPAVSTLGGQLLNWNKGDNYRVLLSASFLPTSPQEIYSSSEIDSAGNFSLTNLAAPPILYMSHVWPAFPDDMYRENTLYCSDSTARASNAYLIMATGTSSYGIGEVCRQNFDFSIYREPTKAGHFRTNYIFVDKNVSLTGRIKLVQDLSDSKFKRMTLNFDLHYKKGWNRKILFIASSEISTSSDSTIYTEELYYTNKEFLEADWYYHFFGR